MEHLERLFSLRGTRALVTGGNSGIGLAIAEALSAGGAKVVLVARREAELEQAGLRIREAGGECDWIACDLADRPALRKLANSVVEHFGHSDILVNAAGVNRRKPMDEISDDDWDVTLALNLSAPFLLAQALAPAMMQKGWGRIINVASLQSVRAFADSVPYGASKGGIMQLTRALAQASSRHGVTCNAIAPGFFPTPLTAAVFNDPARAEAAAARTMIGRNGELQDLRGTAIYLASHASDYVTGQTIFVDGGFSAS
jgi:gluconate 5-dehydrogenase